MSAAQAFGNGSVHEGFTVILGPPNMMEKKPQVLRSVSCVAELRKQAGITHSQGNKYIGSQGFTYGKLLHSFWGTTYAGVEK